MKVAKIFNEINTYNFLLKYSNKVFDQFIVAYALVQRQFNQKVMNK